jgi:TonB family protein
VFSTPTSSGRNRLPASWLLSVLLHVAVLMALGNHATPLFVQPALVAQGDRGTSRATLVYVPNVVAAQTRDLPKPHKALLNLAVRQPTHPKTQPDANPVQAERVPPAQPQTASLAGSPFGSDLNGPLNGDEIRPALPLVFNDPHVARSEIPAGVQGDVIVEITIDAEGKVVEEKLVKSFGYGIDEKVITALQAWRFRPATRNGVAIPSKHDVHYHFPG